MPLAELHNFYFNQKNGNLQSAVVSMSIGDPCGLEWELLSANRLVVIILVPTYFKHQKVYCNLRISKRLQYWPPKRPRIAVWLSSEESLKPSQFLLWPLLGRQKYFSSFLSFKFLGEKVSSSSRFWSKIDFIEMVL